MKTKDRHILQTALSLLQEPSFPSRDGLWDTKCAAAVVHVILRDYDCLVCSERSKMELKLEDAVFGIVDIGGLDNVFQTLQISKHNSTMA